MISKEMVESIGISYPEKFHMNLMEEPFPWFLLSLLFGARIPESIAVRTFYMFKSEGLLTPESLIKRGWESLVVLLDSGGYTRYDFKTATKLIEASKNIISVGSLNKIHESSSEVDLPNNLRSLAKGIGDVTIGIFLREMIGIWNKAKPLPTPLVRATASMLAIDPVLLASALGVRYGLMESFLVNVGRRCFRSSCRKCIFPDQCQEYLKESKNPLLQRR